MKPSCVQGRHEHGQEGQHGFDNLPGLGFQQHGNGPLNVAQRLLANLAGKLVRQPGKGDHRGAHHMRVLRDEPLPPRR